jgi:hypothetical protein
MRMLTTPVQEKLAAALNTNLAKDGFHEAPLGKTTLQQVCTNKSSEPQEVGIHKDGAALDSQAK